VKFSLLATLAELESFYRSVAGPSLILDITSLPKRFFFALLRDIYLKGSITDLILTYTLPMTYPAAPLAENHDPWDALLPTFRVVDPDLEAKAHRQLLVNLGFVPDGLVAHLENRAEEKQIDLIVPFPAPVSAVQRSWQSLWALASTPYKARFNEYRVGALDMAEAFDLIVSLLPSDSNLVSFAPFGPKPISAAMCIFSVLTSSPVYYAQPKVYRPDYSIGVATHQNRPKILAYWIKHDGVPLYDLPVERRGLI
jgi:hypothetical protein